VGVIQESSWGFEALHLITCYDKMARY
jgi:hypothetical protein